MYNIVILMPGCTVKIILVIRSFILTLQLVLKLSTDIPIVQKNETALIRMLTTVNSLCWPELCLSVFWTPCFKLGHLFCICRLLVSRPK